MKNKKYIGKKFGKLTVLESLNDHDLLCKCDCGNTCVIKNFTLKVSKYQMCEVCKGKELLKNKTNQPIIDLTGKRFGSLTVIEPRGTDNQHQRMWLCRCDCGKETLVRGYILRHGRARSCGCILRYKESTRKISDIDINIRQLHYRLNKANKLSDVWKDNLEAFNTWAIENGYKKGYYLSRYNTSEIFSPENCYWDEDCQSKILVDTSYGKMTMPKLSKVSGVPLASIRLRYNNGFRGDDLLVNQQSKLKIKVEPYGEVTFNELSKLTNIPARILRARYKRGDRDAALCRSASKELLTIETPEGKIDFKELSLKTGLPEYTLRSRWRRNGTIEPQSTKSNTSKKIEYNGHIYTQSEFCAKFRITVDTLNYHLRKNESLDDIIARRTVRNNYNPVQVFDLNGNLIAEYKNAVEASKALNMSIARIRHHLSNNVKNPVYIIKRKEN